MDKIRWTSLKARLQLIKSAPDTNYNWLFLPGGPGLGSESLQTLTKILKLPGTIWHLDLPGDGSNHMPDDEKYFSHWSDAFKKTNYRLCLVFIHQKRLMNMGVQNRNPHPVFG